MRGKFAPHVTESVDVLIVVTRRDSDEMCPIHGFGQQRVAQLCRMFIGQHKQAVM